MYSTLHLTTLFLQLTMEEFYRKWFHLQENENPEYSELQSETATEDPVPAAIESENESESGSENKDKGQTDDQATEIAYENSDLKLYVQRGVFKRQKIFKLSDQMYYFKLDIKSETSPLLSSILDFLHAGFLFILRQLRKKIRPDEHSVCYMTLYQHPMINGLNSGSYDLHSKGTNYEIHQ